MVLCCISGLLCFTSTRTKLGHMLINHCFPVVCFCLYNHCFICLLSLSKLFFFFYIYII